MLLKPKKFVLPSKEGDKIKVVPISKKTVDLEVKKEASLPVVHEVINIKTAIPKKDEVVLQSVPLKVVGPKTKSTIKEKKKEKYSRHGSV